MANQETLFDDNEGAGPLLSRCVRLELSRRNLATAFAERVRQIAGKEGLDGKPLSAYVELVRKCRDNMRAMLQEVEAGAKLS